MEADVIWKEFFRDDACYADVINAFGYGRCWILEDFRKS